MDNTKSYCSSLELYTNLLDMIFKFYPDGIACKDTDLKYVFVNKCYCKIFSVNNPKSVIGEKENILLSRQNIRLVSDADNEIKEKLYSMNYVLNTCDDKILSITSSPIVREGLFLGLVSCIKDITHEENIKEAFVNKHFRYINDEKILQAQRETFVASVSHDLKNPTIAQIRSLELLLKGNFGKLSPEQSELLGMILDSCRYMNGMLSSLLATYRNYGGAVKLNFAEFPLEELVLECISEMMYVARDKNLNIKTFFGEANQVCADRVQIKRVIMNLLSNAIKYAYKNTDLLLSVYKNENDIYFEFENKSPYIPDEKRKAIFDRYVSYAGVHKELGIGLGLYASKKIIESHNGAIYVKSFEGDSNIFGFKIPIEQKRDCKKEVLL